MFGGIDMASNLIQTNQIANIQTSKKLIAFYDKRRPALF